MKTPRHRNGKPRIRPADAPTPPTAAATPAAPATPDVAEAVAAPERVAAPSEVAVPQPRVPSADVIRARAYELYVARGRSPGYELEDWLTAERALHADDGPGSAEASPAP